jgi:hypothetical protein
MPPSVVKIDPLFDNDIAVVVLHDVVAMQAVAVLVEIVGAFDAVVALTASSALRIFCGSTLPATVIAFASTWIAS